MSDTFPIQLGIRAALSDARHDFGTQYNRQYVCDVLPVGCNDEHALDENNMLRDALDATKSVYDNYEIYSN